MKILQVTAALEQGGVERGTVEMAGFTVAQGVQSIVASQGGRMVAELRAVGAEHHTLPLARRNPLAIFYCAVRLRKIITTCRIDLVHARSRAPAWAALIACRLTRTPMITTFHGTHRIQNSVKKLYNSSMVRGERVIAISRFISQHVQKYYGVEASRIDIAPRGFDPVKFAPDLFSREQKTELRERLGFSPYDRVISLPGRLTRWKGQTLFLDALRLIPDLSWKALLIGGAGGKAAYLDELKSQAAAFGLGERVVFAGDQAEIALFYAISDIVVSASTEPEAFGRVAVEAQAMGKPVVASNHGGSLETVCDGRTGWLFKNGDAEDLALKLRQVLKDSDDCEKMGIAGRQWVLENFTVSRMCRAEWNSYLKVLPDLSILPDGGKKQF